MQAYAGVFTSAGFKDFLSVVSEINKLDPDIQLEVPADEAKPDITLAMTNGNKIILKQDQYLVYVPGVGATIVPTSSFITLS